MKFREKTDSFRKNNKTVNNKMLMKIARQNTVFLWPIFWFGTFAIALLNPKPIIEMIAKIIPAAKAMKLKTYLMIIKLSATNNNRN